MDNNFNTPNQSFGFESNYVPPSNPVTPKKKAPLALIFGIGGGVLAIILIVTGIFVFKFMNSPKAIVGKAVVKTLDSATDPVGEHLGLTELRETTYKKPCSMSATFSVDSVNGAEYLSSIEGAGLRMEAATDYANKKADADISLQWGGTDIMNCQSYVSGDTIGFACPSLFEGYLSANAKTIGKDYANSVFYDPENPAFDPEESLELFPQNTTDSPIELYKERFPEDYATMIKNMTVVKSDTANASDSTEYDKNNDYYDVTIRNADAQTFLANLVVLFNETGNMEANEGIHELQKMLREDVVLIVAIDNTDRICDLYNSSILTTTEGDVQVDSTISLNGKEDIFSSMEMSMGITENSVVTSGFTLTREAEQGDSTYADNWTVTYMPDMETIGLSINYVSTYNFDEDTMDFNIFVGDTDYSNLSMTGTAAFSNIEKGKSLSVDFSDISVESESDGMDLTLSGDCDIYTENVVVKSPTGEAREVFKYDQTQLSALGNEITQNLMNSPLINALY